MDFFGKEDLNLLLENNDPPCVSIYIPTGREGRGQQNRIRLKNGLQEAERLMKEMDHNPVERGWPARPEALMEDHFFWQNQSHGLAVFLSEDLFRTYRLPLDFQELVVVADRFHLKPLLPMLTHDMRFYVLAFSQNRVRFYRGTQQRIEEMNLENMPGNLFEALGFEEEEKQLQFHTGAAGSKGDRPALFHGHGVPADRDKDRIERYFRVIDGAIHEVLRNDRSPLILAGVEFLFPIYREVNTYPHLMEQGIKGNPDRIKPEELHRRARPIVERRLRDNLEKILERYHNLKGTGKTAAEIDRIVPEAFNGRIDTLIVAMGEQQWGVYDEKNNEVILHGQKEPGDQDLLNLAACRTIVKGGSVYPVGKEDIADGASAMALFRY